MVNTAIKKRPVEEHGFILITMLVIVSVLMIIGISLLSATSSQYSLTANGAYNANAMLTAEAGIEQSLQQLNQSDSFTGYTTAQEFFNNSTQGRATYTTTITASSTDNTAKIITSTAKVYRYKNTTTPTSTRIVRVTVVGTSSPGSAVQAGTGGLILGGIAHIYNSQVSVNGTLTLTGAAGIGSLLVPSTVNVANQACPSGATPGATYPQVCSGTQPINLAFSTFIYGTVCATGQTSKGPNPFGNIQPGFSGGGLTPNCTAAPVQQPTYDRAAQIAAVTTTAASTNNTYVCNSWPYDRTWPANLKLTGNVDISGICNTTINGDVYITGDLHIGGASHINVSNSVGTDRPVVIVDGKITVDGAATISANSSGTGIEFISFKSAAACNPNCDALTPMTGNNLKSSSTLETVSVGGAAILPGMIFDAYWGKITIGGIGSIGSAVGQTIDMSGAGSVTFGTALSSGSHTWTISSYQQKYPGKP